MLLDRALDRLVEGITSIPAETAASVQNSLLQGIRLKGFFPVSASLLSKVNTSLDSDSLSTEDLAEALSSDPVMAVRIIAIANSPLFARSVATETISAAIKHLGLTNISDIISGIAKTQSYQKVFLGRSVAASALEITLVTRILEETLITFFSPRVSRKEELAIYSSLLDLSRLLLAFLHPQIYSAIALHSLVRGAEFSHSFQEVLGFSMVDMANEYATHLGLPQKFIILTRLAQTPPWLKQRWEHSYEDERTTLCTHVMAAKLAEEICSFRGVAAARKVCQDLSRLFVIPSKQLSVPIASLANSLQQREDLLGYSGCPLPRYLSVFETVRGGSDDQSEPGNEWPGVSTRIKSFLYEVRTCLQAKQDKFGNGRISQALYCTLLALVRALDFDRALFFITIAENKSLRPVVLFGQETEDWRSRARYEDSCVIDTMPDIQSMRQRKVIFHGEPVFPGCWPFTAFPLVWRDVVLGVFYADRLEDPHAAPLTTQEEVAVIALAELWQQVPPDFI